MSKEKSLEHEFEILFKKNYSRMFYYSLDFLKDEDAAKDIVSEVFAEIWDKYETIRYIKIEAYLYRAIRNKSINYLKHKDIETQYVKAFLNNTKEANYIDENIEKHEEKLNIIEKTINDLNVKTKFIFTQCYFEGKKYNEVAQLLGLSTSAIHKHVSKAMSSLKKALKDKSNEK